MQGRLKVKVSQKSREKIIALTAQGHNTSFSPRQDRTGVPLSSDNAQAMLPPRACVFVAKSARYPMGGDTSLTTYSLVQTQSDDQLEHHVHIAFLQYGTCYVKIRRDARDMPFAFVQYEVSWIFAENTFILILSERERCPACYL